MKTRPILFNGAMVRAVLSGTKTQTRRALKPQPREDKSITSGRGELAWQTSVGNFIVSTLPTAPKLFVEHCSYGQPGDQLWVREAWGLAFGSPVIPHPDAVIYRADEGNADWDGRWRPSIHMPRWASRITLEIVSVRVERLQDISEADSAAEGIVFDPPVAVDKMGLSSLYRIAYRDLWESINGPGSWDANPWVWVVEFKRVDQ